MSIPQAPKPAKLVTGIFLREKKLFMPAAAALCDAFGPVDMVSSWIDFDYTTYYEREMGAPLFRRILAFSTLIEQESLAEIKTITNGIENSYTVDGRRRLNIDPGYMLHERFVLATGKNFTHRIYIGRQIYADLTLLYVRGGFQALPWTYPDYRDAKMLTWLERVRNKYSVDLKRMQNEKASGE